MLIKDINYLETVNDNIEGGIAVSTASAGVSTATGNNFSKTIDETITNTSQELLTRFVMDTEVVFARFSASGGAFSFSQSS